MIAQLNDIAQVWWQWMAGMFWQASLLIILITLLDIAIRRWAWPQVRYALWGLVFLKLIIPPTWQMPTSIVSWIQPKVEEQISIQIEARETIAQGPQINVSVDKGSLPILPEKTSWQSFVFITWFGGMTTFMLLLIMKVSRLPRHSKEDDEQKVPEWFQKLLAKISDRLNLKKIPAVVFSRDLKSPAVYGLLKPILLLPERCLDKLTEEQAEHVLMHELCHLKRGDLLVHWFCLIIQVIYWFNPLLVWTRRQMRHVCEICCDLSVANLLREKTTAYRNTLLATARELLTESLEPGLGLLGVFEEPFRLVSRLKWLEKKTWENRKQKIAATVCTSLIVIVCVMPMAGLSQTNPKNNNTEIQSNIQVKATGQGIQDENGIAEPIIYLEGLIIAADDNKDLGLEWHTGPRSPSGGQKDEVSDIPDLSLKGEPNSSASPSILFALLKDGITIGGKSFPDIKAAIKAMAIEPGIDILSTPQIATLDNEKASLVIESHQEGNGKLSLEITPQIREDGYILQDITLKVSQPDEGDPSNTVIKNIDTNIVVRDGATVVICSIPENDADENPSNGKELLMFLTTHIINSKEEADNIFQGVVTGTDGQQTQNKSNMNPAQNDISDVPTNPRVRALYSSVTYPDTVAEQTQNYDTNSPSQQIRLFNALVMEVDADKDLVTDAEWIISHDNWANNLNTPTATPTIRINPNDTEQTEDLDDSLNSSVAHGTTGDIVDVEKIETVYGPQSAGMASGAAGGIVNVVTSGPYTGATAQSGASPEIESYMMVGSIGYMGNRDMELRGSFSTSKKDDAEMENGAAIAAKYLPTAFSVGQFNDEISIQGRSFQDITALADSMKSEESVRILGMPRIETDNDEDEVMSRPMELDNDSKVSVGLQSRNNGKTIRQNIILRITPSNEERSKGIGDTVISFPAISKDGGTMVMICSFKDTQAEEDRLAGKKLYVFLTPHIDKK